MAFTFKRWFREEYTFRGEKIGFELKHLTAFEEREVRARVVRAIGASEAMAVLQAAPGAPDEKADKGAEILASVGKAFDPDFLKATFENYVSNVSNVVDGDTGTVRTDGPVILEFGDDAFIWFVLLKLIQNGKVSEEEGKGSGSPSGSASVTAASGSVSPATSTGAEAGSTPSIATVTTVALSSSVPVS